MSGRAVQPPMVVAVTGASGGCYAVRLVEALLEADRAVELTATAEGLRMLRRECGLAEGGDGGEPVWSSLWPQAKAGELIRWRPGHELDAGIASGSYPTAGMIVCPASLNTAMALAGGLAGNLTQRAAQVTLKERRKLVVVLRETPLATLHLERLAELSRSGAIILPAVPAFYHQPRSVAELVDTVVARVLDLMEVDHGVGRRWE